MYWYMDQALLSQMRIRLRTEQAFNDFIDEVFTTKAEITALRERVKVLESRDRNGTRENFAQRVRPTNNLYRTVMELAVGANLEPSTHAVAAEAGCNQSTIIRWLKRGALPKRITMLRIAKALKVNVNSLEKLTAAEGEVE